MKEALVLKLRPLTRFHVKSSAWILLITICALAFDFDPGRAATAASQDQDELVRTSRAAIINTGFSPEYFDKHFKLVQVVNKPGDLRVIWQFTRDDYQLRLNDSIGFYTAAGGRKTYVHSIGNELGKTRNIGKTISKRAAQSKMRSCLGGKFISESVALMVSPDHKPGLYLMAYSAKGRSKEDPDRERHEQKQSRPASDRDLPPTESESGGERPVRIGYINLETGKCSQGEASAASRQSR
jgi:hypothetical protein